MFPHISLAGDSPCSSKISAILGSIALNSSKESFPSPSWSEETSRSDLWKEFPTKCWISTRYTHWDMHVQDMPKWRSISNITRKYKWENNLWRCETSDWYLDYLPARENYCQSGSITNKQKVRNNRKSLNFIRNQSCQATFPNPLGCPSQLPVHQLL